jgi:RHS repeat-associated protein
MGRITQFTTPTSVLVDYKLDWLGRRNIKLVNNSVQRRFIWEDAYRLAAEKIISPAQTKEYVYATSINSPDYMKVGSTLYRILKDHLGSPRLVVRTTDGVVMQRMNYNEWGKIVEDTNPGFQPFAFAGGLYDPDSKLVHFGARDYDAETGRWTTKDPIGFDGGDVNLYGYVLNDPVNKFDPSGLVDHQSLGNSDGGTRSSDYQLMMGLITEEAMQYSKNQINLKAEGRACPLNTPINPILPPPFSPTQPELQVCIMCTEQYDGLGQPLSGR